MNKLNLAIIFGARSPEHEVSIVTTFQVWEWIKPEKYNRFLIYIDHQNQAYLCPRLGKVDYRSFIKKTIERGQKVEFARGGILVKGAFFKRLIPIDVALLVMHGHFGEDGRIQGMLDFLGIPFTGSGVLGSALGMDKVVMKDVFIKMGLKVTPYEWFWSQEFESNPKKIIAKLERKLNYPLFVKPANAGSSVGITCVKKRNDLSVAIKKASLFDFKILVEQGVKNAVDINCAVMGGCKPIVSVCEQPISDEDFLSFKEKYLKGGKTKGMAGLSRIVPAPIPAKVAREIQETTKMIFRELNCWGMARMDFLYQKRTGRVYPNEINTIPGSLAFYLWQASGIKPRQLIDKMIKLAVDRKKMIETLTYKHQSPILDQE